VGRAGWFASLPMPEFIRGSRLEAVARSFAKPLKRAALAVERTLRLGRVSVRLPSIQDTMWIDFDFGVVNSLPSEDRLLAAFIGAIRPGQTIFDVGSFVGSYAIPAARRVGSGRVYAFEPAPASAELLRLHCRMNDVDHQVVVVEAACSEREGSVEMTVWPTGSTTWASGNALRNVYPRSEATPLSVMVKCMRLDDFVRTVGTGPDVIKIDVEGAELWVLEGARETLRSRRPLVFLEIHSFAWSLFNTDESRLRTFLSDVRYALLDLEPPHRPLITIPEYGHALLRPL